jgi:hypothetical protein
MGQAYAHGLLWSRGIGHRARPVGCFYAIVPETRHLLKEENCTAELLCVAVWLVSDVVFPLVDLSCERSNAFASAGADNSDRARCW